MTGAQSIPTWFPIFPLRGCLMLPGGSLPFNIFEPRYLAMLRDVMRGDRVIGLIQPRHAESVSRRPELFATGCVCRVTACTETEDGRFEIMMDGLCRFDVAEELSVATPYRQVRADLSRWRGDFDPIEPPEALRPRLIASTRRYFGGRGITTDWEVMAKTPLAALVTTLAMLCPFGAAEKQALLEAADSGIQAELLVTIMGMELAGGHGDEPAVRH